MVQPVPVASMMVTMFIKAFCAVSDKRSKQPASLNKLPSINIPINAVTEGNSKEMMMVHMIGKVIFTNLETGRNWLITILRSAAVVQSIMIGG